MGLPVEVNNLMMGSLGGYTVGRSLRFRSSASAFLSRTFTSAGSQTTWTFSTWIKRGSANGPIFAATTGSGNTSWGLWFNGDNIIWTGNSGSGGATYAQTSAVYRDYSAWYHIVLKLDTTNATAANRFMLWVNGVQVTNWTINPASGFTQNSTWFINGASYHTLNTAYTPSGGYFGGYADQYFAETYFIDGQALNASSFGAYDTNGVWQPKKYSGTYGTNGFYLPFSNTTSTTTLVQDASGNGNNWTANNISLTAGTTYDSMIDSPTPYADGGNGRGNYPVINRINNPNGATISSGNLSFEITSGSQGSVPCTMSASSGKWYAELYNIQSATSVACGFGAAPVSTFPYNSYIGSSSNQCSFWKGSGGGSPYYWVNATTQTSYQYVSGDVGLMAVDIDNGKMWCGLYRSGTTYWFDSSAGTSGNPVTGANPCATFTAGTEMYFGATGIAMSTGPSSINFGQQNFTGTPPSGYKALNTYNLPAPSIANGAQYMAASLYTGNGGTAQTITNTVNSTSFQPDFVWIKSRNSASFSHRLYDSVRGAGKELYSNATNAESTVAQSLTAFASNGFTLGTDTNNNASGTTYVGWQWKGGGSGVSNTAGTITSQVSANTSAGISILTYSGNGTNGATVGHGLGVKPDMVIIKGKSGTFGDGQWIVQHKSLSGGVSATSTTCTLSSYTSVVFLNLINAAQAYGFDAQVNGASGTYVAYCFSAVRGFSAFGSYTGNGSSDGPFVFTNMRPRFVMVKRTDTSGTGWQIHDTSRNTYNVMNNRLQPNNSDAESTYTTSDFLSNGFKLRDSDASWNASGGTYIYAAFAENPFNYSRAR